LYTNTGVIHRQKRSIDDFVSSSTEVSRGLLVGDEFSATYPSDDDRGHMSSRPTTPVSDEIAKDETPLEPFKLGADVLSSVRTRTLGSSAFSKNSGTSTDKQTRNDYCGRLRPVFKSLVNELKPRVNTRTYHSHIGTYILAHWDPKRLGSIKRDECSFSYFSLFETQRRSDEEKDLFTVIVEAVVYGCVLAFETFPCFAQNATQLAELIFQVSV